ncbi:MAG: TetR/AcrR family transcriptional regulator [Verrucomicrobiota bacterium]
MARVQTTQENILAAALSILKEFGTEGLTMRKVAAEASMSLGNLQYHFKDRTFLLAGLADHYFSECSALLDDYEHSPPGGTSDEKLTTLLSLLLEHVDPISDMCRIFREMWTLAARDEEMQARLVQYYQTFYGKLTHLLSPIAGSEEAAEWMAHLIVPYLEGYSITFAALPRGKAETVAMLVNLCLHWCEEETQTDS